MRQTPPKVLKVQERARGPLSPCQVWWGLDFTCRRGGQNRWQEGHLACKNWGLWRWALVSPDGVAPSRMVCVSASVNLLLHHTVQKFSSGTSSPGWSRKKGREMLVDNGVMNTYKLHVIMPCSECFCLFAVDSLFWSVSWPWHCWHDAIYYDEADDVPQDCS